MLRVLKAFWHPHKAALPSIFFSLCCSIQLVFRFYTAHNKSENELELEIETETESRSRTAPSVCRVSFGFRFVFKLKLTRRNEKLAWMDERRRKTFLFKTQDLSRRRSSAAAAAAAAEAAAATAIAETPTKYIEPSNSDVGCWARCIAHVCVRQCVCMCVQIRAWVCMCLCGLGYHLTQSSLPAALPPFRFSTKIWQLAWRRRWRRCDSFSASHPVHWYRALLVWWVSTLYTLCWVFLLLTSRFWHVCEGIFESLLLLSHLSFIV